MTESFGCERCGSPDPDTAWAWFRDGTDTTHTVVDDSHFIVSVRRCRACGQPFLSVFTEFVDWTGGDDAQYRDIVPVTADEVEELLRYGETVDPGWLGSLGRDRRRLSTDWPTGGAFRVGWRRGGFTVRPGG